MLNPNNLYYSDTDSFCFTKPLPDNLIGDHLGQLKLEYKIKEALFPMEKCYILETTDGKKVKKFKGLKANSVKDEHYQALYRGENIHVEQQRFVLSTTGIKTKKTKYLIQPNKGIKRIPIFDINNT